MKTLFTLFSLSLVFVINGLHAQPEIEWQRCLGGTGYDNGFFAQQTSDGGYILTGRTSSSDGDVIGFHGGQDIWVVKLSLTGDIQWQKCLGGTGVEYGNSIQQTTDGGYILTGYAESNDSVFHNDLWVIKLSSTGEIEWQQFHGGINTEWGESIQQLPNGEYIISGIAASNDGDVSGNHGDFDIWVVKLSSAGDIQWQKCLGGIGREYGESIQQTSDGGYIVGGRTTSNDGDVSGNHGGQDIWVVKLSSAGDIQWQKCLGGSGEDIGAFTQQTSDGGYIVGAATTASNDGDVVGNHGGEGDVWVVKLSSTGHIEWQKCLGGTGGENSFSNLQMVNGGYIVSGSTRSNDGDVSGNHGGQDIWVVKLSSAGDIQWQKCLGGSVNENSYSIQQTTDGGYILTGRTSSSDGDVIGFHGYYDVWVVKLSPVITESPAFRTKSTSLQIFPNPSTGRVNLKTEAALVGEAFQVFNAKGKAVLNGQISAEEMPLSTEDLPVGIYTIVSAGQTARLVKE
jgi:hypothetical protein